MAPLSTILLLPASLLVLIARAAAREPSLLTLAAVKKLPPQEGEKILAEHLAFAPAELVPRTRLFLHDALDDQPLPSNGTDPPYLPPFAHHQNAFAGRGSLLSLALLQKRSSCPAGMGNCADQGSPNKCCQEGTYCTTVPDAAVGQIACCPQGSRCGGDVGRCPSEAAACPASLGGGCCIPGYVCQGVGCIPSASSMPTAASPTSAPAPETTTVTQTTMVRGSPSLVIVTLTVTRTSSAEASTRTTTRVVTTASTGTESATGIPPWRPTGPSSATQSGCPTGFYGCLAVHGGGCCRTDRDCQTHSCPATTSTTVVAAGATVVVPAADVPTATTRGSCADGWSLCGDEAGPVAGCCPSGYSCGTASCFAGGATDTGGLQKALPASPSATSSAVGKSFASSSQLLPASGLVVGLALLLAMA